MKTNKLFRSLLIFLILAAVFYTIITKLTDFKDAKFLLEIKPLYLGLALGAWFLSYLALGLKLKILLKALNYRFQLRELMKFGALGVFAVHFLPMGNFGESALNFHLLRRRGVKTSSALALFLTRLASDYLAFFIIFLIALAFLKTRPALNSLTTAAFIIILLLLIIGIIIFFYFLSIPPLFKSIAKKILKSLKKTFNFIKDNSQKDPEAYFDKMSTLLYRDFKILVRKKRLLLSLILSSAFYWLTDCGILYFSLIGLGVKLGFDSIFFAYSIANIVALISFLPAGIGVFEASLILILRSFSLNAPAITLGVFSYRFISLWLAIPLGFLAFYSLNKQQKIFPQLKKSQKKK